jgi:hypothetical protein
MQLHEDDLQAFLGALTALYHMRIPSVVVSMDEDGLSLRSNSTVSNPMCELYMPRTCASCFNASS